LVKLAESPAARPAFTATVPEPKGRSTDASGFGDAVTHTAPETSGCHVARRWRCRRCRGNYRDCFFGLFFFGLSRDDSVETPTELRDGNPSLGVDWCVQVHTRVNALRSPANTSRS